MRWGMIGCGSVAELKSAPAYRKVKGFELAAVMARNTDRVEDYAARHNIAHTYSSAEQLIENVDAVYIATPPDSHTDYAIKTLQAGKPCCIEKPMAVSHQDAKKVVDVFEKNKVPLFVAYYRRSLPRFNKIKAWIEHELIGDIRHINWNFSKPVNDLDISGSYNWRTDPKVAPGGYFDDLACHGFDLFNYLLGNIEDANGIATNQMNLYGAKDAITASWLHPNNITGSGSWNFGACERKDEVEITGSRGVIRFSIFGDAPIYLHNRVGSKEEFISNPNPIQLPHVQGMRDALLYGRPHPSTGKTALHANWVMDKIR